MLKRETSVMIMNGEDQYSSMESGYPNPIGEQQHSHPRSQYSQPPDQRQSGSRFKVLDDQWDQDPARQYESGDTKRDQIPSFHTLPNPENTRFVSPFNHAMKRTGNAERMREIFGDVQSYSGMDDIDFSKDIHKREEFGVNPMVMAPPPSSNNSQWPATNTPQTYIPRMKYVEGPPAEAPAREIMKDVGSRRKIYNAIIAYFPGFILSKTAIHGRHSVYKGVVRCLLCDGTRYIVAIVKDDQAPIGTKKPLTMLPWDSFQTRWSEDDEEHRKFKMSSHQYARPDHTILDDVIRLSRKTSTANLYNCDNLELQVEILRTKEEEDLAEVGTVSSALEIFQTIINFTE